MRVSVIAKLNHDPATPHFVSNGARCSGASERIENLLGNHQARFDCLTEAHLVCKQHPFRERRSEGEERGVHLVRVQVHLGIDQRGRQPINAVCGCSSGEFMGPELRVIRRHRDKCSVGSQRGCAGLDELVCVICVICGPDLNNLRHLRPRYAKSAAVI